MNIFISYNIKAYENLFQLISAWSVNSKAIICNFVFHDYLKSVRVYQICQFDISGKILISCADFNLILWHKLPKTFFFFLQCYLSKGLNKKLKCMTHRMYLHFVVLLNWSLTHKNIPLQPEHLNTSYFLKLSIIVQCWSGKLLHLWTKIVLYKLNENTS